MISIEYDIIQSFYGDRKAERSQVPLMNHIDEGLEILDATFAGTPNLAAAKRAWCLHPLVQADDDLVRNLHTLGKVDGEIVALAMEYRRVANAYLSTRVIASIEYDIELSPLEEVNRMLYADKVQNNKDFRLYHLETHPRSVELERYFFNWISKLDRHFGL